MAQQGRLATRRQSRLLAAVVAKNAVGSSWRKTVATRTYSRLPDAERGAVRALALELLFAEPSPRVATQLSLLVTNIARCAAGARPRLQNGCTDPISCNALPLPSVVHGNCV